MLPVCIGVAHGKFQKLLSQILEAVGLEGALCWRRGGLEAAEGSFPPVSQEGGLGAAGRFSMCTE